MTPFPSMGTAWKPGCSFIAMVLTIPSWLHPVTWGRKYCPTFGEKKITPLSRVKWPWCLAVGESPFVSFLQKGRISSFEMWDQSLMGEEMVVGVGGLPTPGVDNLRDLGDCRSWRPSPHASNLPPSNSSRAGKGSQLAF